MPSEASSPTPTANSWTVPFLILTFRRPLSRMPVLPSAPVPSIVRRPRSSVIPSLPMTSPSPGQFVRSARSLVSEVSVAPQATSRPLACAAAGAANATNVSATTNLKKVIHGI